MSSTPLLLTEYMPRSELVVERQTVTQPKFPVIDAHTHFGPLTNGPDFDTKYDTEAEVAKLRELGLEKVVTLEVTWDAELDRVFRKLEPCLDFFVVFGSVDVSRLDEPDFERSVWKTVSESKAKGVRGLKMWKNISLGMKDKDGKYVPIDDKRLQPIWQAAADLDLPILIHIADPVAFFRPIDQYNERYENLLKHPDWSFCAPELFTFEELMEQQENLIASNPNTTFVVAHGGSYSENLSQVAAWLRRYPNMHIDIAARLAEFGRQPYTSRRFFTEFQDRILFGTDYGPGYYDRTLYYEFLETWNEYFPYTRAPIPGQGRWNIYGIGLEDEILEKVYNKNAKRILKI